MFYLGNTLRTAFWPLVSAREKSATVPAFVILYLWKITAVIVPVKVLLHTRVDLLTVVCPAEVEGEAILVVVAVAIAVAAGGGGGAAVGIGTETFHVCLKDREI